MGAGNLAVLERAVDELARRYSMEWQVRTRGQPAQAVPREAPLPLLLVVWPVAVSLALSPSSRQDSRPMRLHTPAAHVRKKRPQTAAGVVPPQAQAHGRPRQQDGPLPV